MLAEHDQVVLTRDLPEHGLVAGDIGAVLAVHLQGTGFTLEFTTLQGDTLAIVTVRASDIWEAGKHEVAHARVAE